MRITVAMKRRRCRKLRQIGQFRAFFVAPDSPLLRRFAYIGCVERPEIGLWTIKQGN
ncbi:hypothetical protein [Defluviimonas sp. D31]|uniref:hypothetical protein n=1 Tax=Defluviimonas sp. D31 TaxID=3083253 RepID=UPI00296F62C0|nr:hypothetical protein [Defluviimonas sp. D31]